MAKQHSTATNRYKYAGRDREHVVIAERALGKPLPRGAQVHHVDEDKSNNLNSNLVICQDNAYHALLHVRRRVLLAGGNPNTERLCADCKQLRSIETFPINRRRADGRSNQCRPCIAKRVNARYHFLRVQTEHLCECGCGVRTWLVVVAKDRSQIGKPARFIKGHSARVQYGHVEGVVL